MGKRQKKNKMRHGTDGTAAEDADECIAKMTDEQRAVADELLSKCLKMVQVHQPVNASRDELQQTTFSSGVCDVISEQSRLSIEARRRGLDPRATPKISRITAETKALLPALGIWTQDVIDANVSWHCESFMTDKRKQTISFQRHFAALLGIVTDVVERFEACKNTGLSVDAKDGYRNALIWLNASVPNPSLSTSEQVWKPTHKGLFRTKMENKMYAEKMDARVGGGFLWIGRWMSWDARSTMFVRVRSNWVKQLVWLCHQVGCTNPGVKHCSTCRAASYCSLACQRLHWSKHKASCGSLKCILEVCFSSNESSDETPGVKLRSITRLVAQYAGIV